MFRPNNHLFDRAQTAELKQFADYFEVAPDDYPTIGHDVWIGANVTLSAQVKVGTGAVISSGALSSGASSASSLEHAATPPSVSGESCPCL